MKANPDNESLKASEKVLDSNQDYITKALTETDAYLKDFNEKLAASKVNVVAFRDNMKENITKGSEGVDQL